MLTPERSSVAWAVAVKYLGLDVVTSTSSGVMATAPTSDGGVMSSSLMTVSASAGAAPVETVSTAPATAAAAARRRRPHRLDGLIVLISGPVSVVVRVRDSIRRDPGWPNGA